MWQVSISAFWCSWGGPGGRVPIAVVERGRERGRERQKEGGGAVYSREREGERERGGREGREREGGTEGEKAGLVDLSPAHVGVFALRCHMSTHTHTHTHIHLFHSEPYV